MPALLGHVIGTNEALIIDDRDRRHGLALVGTANRGVHDLLINLLLDDLKNGCGVFLLDPAGDAITALLKRGDLSRLGDALFLDPEDPTHSFGINPLACRDIADRGARTETYRRVYAIFQKLWEHEWVARPWLQMIIQHTLRVFIANPQYTLAKVPLFLTNSRFRDHVLSTVIHHPESIDFWQHQFSAEQTEAEVIWIRTFLEVPIVRQIVGQHQTTIDLSAVMNNVLVLLVKLPPTLPEVANRFISNLLISELMQAVRNRIAFPPEKRHQFCIYLNGFQDLLSAEDYMALQPQTDLFNIALDFAALHTQVDNLNIALTVAYQKHPGKSEAAQNLLDTRLANTVCFQLTDAAAQVHAPEFVIRTGERKLPEGRLYSRPVDSIWKFSHENPKMMDIRSRYFWLAELPYKYKKKRYFQFDPTDIPHLHTENPVHFGWDEFDDLVLYRSSAEMLQEGISLLNTFYYRSMQGDYDREQPIDHEQLQTILQIVTNLGGVLGFGPMMIPYETESLLAWKIRPFTPDEETQLTALIQTIMDALVLHDALPSQLRDTAEKYLQVCIARLPPERRSTTDVLVKRIHWQLVELVCFLEECILQGSILLRKGGFEAEIEVPHL